MPSTTHARIGGSVRRKPQRARAETRSTLANPSGRADPGGWADHPAATCPKLTEVLDDSECPTSGLGKISSWPVTGSATPVTFTRVSASPGPRERTCWCGWARNAGRRGSGLRGTRPATCIGCAFSADLRPSHSGPAVPLRVPGGFGGAHRPRGDPATEGILAGGQERSRCLAAARLADERPAGE